MKKEIKIFGIFCILFCVCLSGCNDHPVDHEETYYNTVTVDVYARVNVENDNAEEMTPHASIDITSESASDSILYPPSGGLVHCTFINLKYGETIVVTAVHTDGNKTYSDTKSLTFKDASDEGRRAYYSWSAECFIVVPGGLPISEDKPINLTIGASVSVIHLYWNESISNYDSIYKGVSDVVKIEMRAPYSETFTFTETTSDGTVYVEKTFLLKRTELIQVLAVHQATDSYDTETFIHDGTYSSDHYWNPELEIYVYMTNPE